MRELSISDPRHVQLVDRFTHPKQQLRWTVSDAIHRSRMFESVGSREGGFAAILLDKIAFHRPPVGGCRDQLLTPTMAKAYPLLRSMVSKPPNCMDSIFATLRNTTSLTGSLDDDELFALVAYTFDNCSDQSSNLYYVLNQALRERLVNSKPFTRWQGFLYYLMRAVEKLPAFQGTVYRGITSNVNPAQVKKDYAAGRPVQWAAFSSASRREGVCKNFVHPKEGVVFRISVVSGRQVGQYSIFPAEDEVLLTPNTQFTVTREMYKDTQGYHCVDLAETVGSVLMS